MKVKKCGFLLSLFMMVCFAIPSFAKAEVLDYLEGKIGLGYSNNRQMIELTDGNITTSSILSNGDYYVYYLNKINDAKQVKLLAEGDISGLKIEFYSGFNMVLGYADKSFKSDGKYYVMDVSALGNTEFNQFRIKYSGKNLKIYDLKLLNGVVEKPLNDITNLNAIEGVSDVYLTWKNPSDPNFERVRIYKDGSIIATIPKSSKSEFKVEGLEPNKSYDFAKLLPFVVPLLILLGALLFADRFIDLIYRALGTRK